MVHGLALRGVGVGHPRQAAQAQAGHHGQRDVVYQLAGAAAWLFTSIQQRFLGMQRGQRGPLPRPIDPAAMETMWTPQEKAGVQRMLAATAVGAPQTVRRQLQAIVEQTAADELIVAGAIHDHAARLRSYELLAGLQAA